MFERALISLGQLYLLSMNYIRDYQSFTLMKAILEDYKNNYLEKENIDLPASEMGVILKEVSPDATRVQRRVNGCRSWLYSVVKLNLNDPQQSHSADVIRWEDLPKLTAELGWQVSDQTDHYFEWMKIQSQDVCNGNRVFHGKARAKRQGQQILGHTHMT